MSTETKSAPPEIVKPHIIRINRTRETEKLYTLERKRNDAIKAAAKEYAKVMDHPAREYWSRTIPQALFDTLESFQGSSSYAAAKAYCEWYETREAELLEAEKK